MYDFFLSHSSKNKELAKIIYYTSLANGLSVWYDERYLKPGNHLRESFKRGIQESAGYLLLCSQEALESEWMPVEMEMAREKKSRDPNFVLTVVLLDDSQPPEWLMKYRYIKWNTQDEPGSTLELISHLTGKEPVTTITGASFLTSIPSMQAPNEYGTIAEHSRNFVFYYIAHLKSLIQNMAHRDYGESLAQTAELLDKLWMFQQLPALQSGIMPLGNGEYEVIHPARMRKPPIVTIRLGSDDYYAEKITTNEVSTRFALTDSETNKRVNHPVPINLSIELDAEL